MKKSVLASETIAAMSSSSLTSEDDAIAILQQQQQQHDDDDGDDDDDYDGSSSSSQQKQPQQQSFIGPALPPPKLPLGMTSSDIMAFERSLHGRRTSLPSTLRHVQLVSKRAALATKKQIWDSNDASIIAAQSAVDQWEQVYNAIRGIVLATGNSARGVYGAAKAGAFGLEHGFLVPVRDWILLPAFVGVERVAGETVGFLQSEHAETLAHQSLHIARQIPFGIGENFLAPALCIGAEALKRTWDIAQYPIPSPHQVRDSVDFVMTGTKWALTTAGREVALYMKRADANITRTLSHTQWKVLGSGPYATLDALNKRDVIDHLCERYFSLMNDAVARYELAAHIRLHNRPLYHDLVLTGLLRERGGDLTKEDEWLSSCPTYRSLESPFLLPLGDSSSASNKTTTTTIDESAFPLWFRLPYHNGKRPGKDTPWVCFCKEERLKLESHYHAVHAKFRDNNNNNNSAVGGGGLETECPQTKESAQKYGTNAKWYDPDMENDLFLDQKRHAVSFFPCCPKCRQRHNDDDHNNNNTPPLRPKQFGELCNSCSERDMDAPWVDALLSPPPMTALYRPTMWRFYGRGDELRRAAWLLDTQRHGLQPFGEDAQAILEDAYLFLKWKMMASARQCNNGRRDSGGGSSSDSSNNNNRDWDEGEEEDDNDDILLTVQVPSPDGSEHLLVQFSSLNSATAIGKGLIGAIALFKRRVYRGGTILPGPSVTTSTTPTTSTTTSSSSTTSSVVNKDDNTVRVDNSETTTTSSDAAAAAARPLSDRKNNKKETVRNDTKQAIDDDNDDDNKSKQQVVEESSELSSLKHKNGQEDDMNIISDKGESVKQENDGNLAEPPTNVELETISDQHQEQQPVGLLAYPFDNDESMHSDDDNDDTDNVDHLVLIVHGVGEMLQSIDLFGLTKIPTIVDCCDCVRKNHAEVLAVRFHQLYQSLDGIQQPRRGRVEYLPIEWHESFTIQSQRRLLSSVEATNTNNNNNNPRGFTINDVSLRTIPQMRQFANDTLMDVLYFMSPEHHDIIIDIVVHEMNFVVQKFRRLTGFTGDISLVGHSLGSIISWDILDNQHKNVGQESSSGTDRQPHQQQQDSDEDGNLAEAELPSRIPVGAFSLESDFPEVGTPPEMSHTELNQCQTSNCEGSDTRLSATTTSGTNSRSSSPEREAPESSTPVNEEYEKPSSTYPQLDFKVDNAFMLGSPIAVFLMIRNQRKPLSPDFSLKGCSQVFNIFHPYDPVAYRIEPLIDPANAEIEPRIMAHWHGGFRFQYKTKRLWRMIVEQTLKTQDTVLESLESGIAALGLLDEASNDLESAEQAGGIGNNDNTSSNRSNNHGNYVVTGNLNNGQRIDYMLQEKEIENANEYVAALAAHSCYWLEKDLSLFIARQICLRALERETKNQALFSRQSSSSL